MGVATKGAARSVALVALCFSALGVTVVGMQIASRCSRSPAIEVPTRFEARRVWTDEKALRALRIETFKLRRSRFRLWEERFQSGANALWGNLVSDAERIVHVASARDLVQVAMGVGSELSVRGHGFLKFASTAARVFLLLVLCGGCVFGDVAAAGACALWAIGLHASKAAFCRCFTMLVISGLDAKLFSLECKLILCAVSSLGPVFPPKQRSAVEKAKTHTPLIVEAFEPQAPEPADDGGEILCDEPPLLKVTRRLNAKTPSTTGQVIELAASTKRVAPVGETSQAKAEKESENVNAPLIVEASEPQAPEPADDGGEILCDEPPLWRVTRRLNAKTQSATCQVIETSAAAKRVAPVRGVSRAKAAKESKKVKTFGTNTREGLFFDQQQGAWCGMHALNNYLLGPFVNQDSCRLAAHQVAQRLTDAQSGSEEPMSRHLDPETGWLSIDVINVLCHSNLGLHVDVATTTWRMLQTREDGAALLNWNQQHWTVLQRDPSGEGWMHTNSIPGMSLSSGRRRRLLDQDVKEFFKLPHALNASINCC